MKEIILRPYQLDSIEALRENIGEKAACADAVMVASLHLNGGI